MSTATTQDGNRVGGCAGSNGSRWTGRPGKGKSAKAIHVHTRQEMNVGAVVGTDPLWREEKVFRSVRVMAVAEGYAMVRRPGCMPYVCPLSDLYENTEISNRRSDT